jgi:hypothetical protein
MRNTSISLLPSVVRTATNAVTLRTEGARGIAVVLKITAGTTLDIIAKIKGIDPVSGEKWDILASASKTGAGTTVLTVYPGITVAANVSASYCLPEDVEVELVHGNSNNATYTVSAQMLS